VVAELGTTAVIFVADMIRYRATAPCSSTRVVPVNPAPVMTTVSPTTTWLGATAATTGVGTEAAAPTGPARNTPQIDGRKPTRRRIVKVLVPDIGSRSWCVVVAVSLGTLAKAVGCARGLDAVYLRLIQVESLAVRTARAGTGW
jgi:hypothetical protein